MEKKDIRNYQIKSLTKFAQSSIKSKEDRILREKFLNSNLLKNVQKIGITISMPIEVETTKIITALWKMGKEVFIPRCLPKREMEFTKYMPDTNLTKTNFGTFENWSSNVVVNNNLDLIVLPGLSFGKNDHARLGFGGGYYDRFLANYPILTVALANSKQIISNANWTVEKHDIAVDKIITID